MLYLVPTPIGNLEDMSFRCIRTLREVDVIYAEDTRTSGILLKHYDIKNELRSYHSFNEHRIVDQIVLELQQGKNAALITDAGTPGISDPGFLLVRACRQANIKVSCLPGPVAFIPVLASSGLSSDAFHFEGFLPHKKGRQTCLKRLSELEVTFIIYESPHRLIKCLTELAEVCGQDRMACVGREVSKLFEEINTDTLENLFHHYSKTPAKGEIVIVVSGKVVEKKKQKYKYDDSEE